MPATLRWSRLGQSRAEQKAILNAGLLVESIALRIWDHAKRRHTFRNRTGELEKSIRVSKLPTGRSFGSKVIRYRVAMGVGKSIGIGPNRPGYGESSKAYYALFVELGTVKMAPRPTLRPAMNYVIQLYRRGQIKITSTMMPF